MRKKCEFFINFAPLFERQAANGKEWYSSLTLPGEKGDRRQKTVVRRQESGDRKQKKKIENRIQKIE